MRLDKFMKVSRIIKRRTIAKEICEQGRIQVNGRTGKPGTDVKAGDILNIGFGKTNLVVEVLATPENIRANLADTVYRIIQSSNDAENEYESK